MHQPFGRITCAAKVEFQEVDNDEPWKRLDDSPPERYYGYTLEEYFSKQGNRHGLDVYVAH